MEICRKEHKKVEKKFVKNIKIEKKENIQVPDWFNKENNLNTNNLSEFDDVLKEFD